MNTIRIITLCTALVVFSSCQGKPVNAQEIAGIYDLESPHAHGYLELGANGIYTQKTTTRNGATKEVKGHWHYAPPSSGSVNRGIVRIFGALRERDGNLEKADSTFSISLSVYGSGSALSLYLSPDGNESYVKK